MASMKTKVELNNASLTPCPCCGARVITQKGGYEICNRCGWEDDPVQQKNPDLSDGANSMSLNQAREDWRVKCSDS